MTLDELPRLTVRNGLEGERNLRARKALVAYLRLLAECINDEADLLEENSPRVDGLIRRFRSEVLDMSLKDAPVEALLDRIGG